MAKKRITTVTWGTRDETRVSLYVGFTLLHKCFLESAKIAL